MSQRMTEAQWSEHQRRVRISQSKTRVGSPQGREARHGTPAQTPHGQVTSAAVPGVRIATHASSPSTTPGLSITVVGEPLGKPRMTRRDTWKERACVIRYRQWCDKIRFVAGWTKKASLVEPTTLRMIAYFAIPASWPLQKREAAIGQPHQQKPDIDNICKGVMDALIENDQYIYKLHGQKYWDDGQGERVEIMLDERGQP